MKKFDKGDKVIILEGASDWMKLHNYWLDDSMGDSIDNYGGTIKNDYTNLPGNDSHYGVDIGFDFTVGINPMWLKLV